MAIERTEVMRLDTSVFNLAYDAATDSLWFAQMGGGADPDYLYWVDATTGESKRWDLPETLHNGFLTEVEVADDGGVWISYEYQLLRFDQAAETLASHAFPIVQPTANRYGGTWISGLGTDGESVWVVLNGLPEVALIDAQLREVRRVPLSDSWRNAVDIVSADGLLFVVRKGMDDGQGTIVPGGVGVFSQAGEELAFTAIEAQRLIAIEGRVLAYPDDTQRGNTAWVGSDGRAEVIDTGSFDDAATALSPTAAVVYSNPFGEDPARIVRYEDEIETALAVFEKRLVASEICRGPLTIASASALPSCPPILVGAPEIDAIVASPTGTIWYFENFSGQAAILWRLQP